MALIHEHSTDEVIWEEMRRMREMYKLKRTLRYESTRDHTVHSESVAEHIFTMLMLLHYFLPLEDPAGELDRERLVELTLYHEIGEIETGDIMFNLKTGDLKAIERDAAAAVAERLPESMREVSLARFREFDATETAEARFVDALDKIEPIFELFDDENLKLFRKHGINQETAVGKKHLATADYPIMRRFLEAWTVYAVSRDTFPE